LKEQHTDNHIIDISGYLQDLRYFDSYKETVINAFNIESEPQDICSVHVRRGDYTKLQKYHPCCSIDYYKSAINIIRDKHKNMRFKIFSDDIKWCKDNFKWEDFLFSEGKAETEDFIEMTGCKCNINANSTFSWWASYLNINPTKTVIYPSKWFGSGYPNHDASGYAVEGWIRV
jgi:hypothetical protein